MPTNRYNAQSTLDRVVWAADGWLEPPEETDDETILAWLLVLMLERAVLSGAGRWSRMQGIDVDLRAGDCPNRWSAWMDVSAGIATSVTRSCSSRQCATQLFA